MFQGRTSSQKPGKGLYAAFRRTFPEVCLPPNLAPRDPGGLANNPSEQLRTPSQTHKHIDASRGSWNSTLPLPDLDIFPPPTCASQTLAYFTPPAEEASTLYCNEDVDMTIPEMGMDMGIRPPELASTSRDGTCPGWMAEQGMQPFDFNSQSSHFDPTQVIAPYYLSWQPSDFVSLDGSPETPPADKYHTETEVHFESPNSSQAPSISTPQSLQAFAEKFRFHTTLNAATAMVQQPNEIPVTYLNKGNVYSISIVDTAPAMPGSTPVWYRTSIRISFEDGQHGREPSRHWNFWREGRGNDEFHQRGGKMQGVEYVEARPATEDDTMATVKLETACIDGFTVLWTRGSGDSAGCDIGVRFNFLSTDFSHSKGVKGIPSRFCAKTEIVSADSPYCSLEAPEICFCEVKVFRDHGAERKIANDAASVTKNIDKLKKHIAQAETETKIPKKRKRNGPTSGESLVKNTKHRRARSMSSSFSTEEDIYARLQMMQDILASTQPVSILNIRGQEQDDPDLHPIELPDDHLGFTKLNMKERTSGQQMTDSRDLCVTKYPTPVSSSPSSSSPISCSGSPTRGQQSRFQPTVPTGGLQRGNTGIPAKWTKPPQMACFCIIYPKRQNSGVEEYYQVVYILKREARGLIARTAAKCNFDPTRAVQKADVNQDRLDMKADESAIYELRKGHGMVLDLSRITALAASCEWDKLSDANFNGEDAKAIEDAIQSEGYLFKLIL